MAYEIFEKILDKMIKIKPIKEYKFHNTRKWRIDYAWPEQKLAIEIEGGIWSNGRHTRSKGFINDIEKYNEIVLYGFSLLRIPSGKTIQYGIDIIIRWFKNNYSELLY